MSHSATPWTVPARLLHPWHFLGKITGVGCHFLLQCFLAPLDLTLQDVWFWVNDHTIMIIWLMKIFLYSSSVYSCYLFLISSASVQMVNTKIIYIIFFAAKDGVALYSQQKQDWELTVAQIINCLFTNSD